jgi:hypothetical protein
MIIAVIALLVGRSQSFASLHFVLRGNTSRASNSQKPKFSNESTINSYAWYLQAIPSKFSCTTFQKNPSKYFSICDTVFSSWGRSGRICFLPYCFILKKGEKNKKGTPPWYAKVSGHPMESVSHGL